MCHSILACSFCWEISLQTYRSNLVHTNCIPLATVNIVCSQNFEFQFSCVLVWTSLGSSCVRLYISWTCTSISFVRLGSHYVVIIFSNCFPISCFLFSFYYPYDVNVYLVALCSVMLKFLISFCVLTINFCFMFTMRFLYNILCI